ncbi:MAG: zinc carboxypeptidase, partial [Phaeodactylibacter sp.]|nr:zinc carboxypeptidase [Phaeodactylibacter sp.]
TNWYRSVANRYPDPAMATREHREPWPGGRVNHYLFDLNRDWAWLTQVESQQRIIPYQEWLPHVHVDFHEQFPNDPYYFAPAARPYHKYITDWQAELQTTIGKNNAKHFDEEGWLYFTKEVFDLLYPSYGDTYPTFNGAIGMTYEQAGHGISGRGILMENGDTLTLQDRIDHHTTAALSTIEVAAKNVAKINAEFRMYYENSRNNPPGNYKTFVIKADNTAAKLNALTQLLDQHRIVYKRAGAARRTSGVDYLDLDQKMFEITPEDLIISTNQPKGLLVQVLFEPAPQLEDSLTYDITAWALPYAYGLQAYASLDRFEGREAWEPESVSIAKPGAYAYAHTWESVADGRFLGLAQRAGLKARFSDEEITLNGKNWPAGTIVYTRADNRKLANWDKTLTELAAAENQALTAWTTGFADAGHDLGSESMHFIQQPKVLLAAGEQTDANSFGHAWYYFEQTLGYPVSVLEAEAIRANVLADYNVLVLPDGRYRWNSEELQGIREWVQGGGKVIALGAAVSAFSDQSGFQLKSKSNSDSADIDSTEDLVPYSERNRDFLKNFIPGAIFRLKMDASHPLAFGLGDYYFSLKTISNAYSLMERGWNVGTVDGDPLIVGFAGSKAAEGLENSVVLGAERAGRGQFIYLADNPLFRGFWFQGQLLMASALFLN